MNAFAATPPGTVAGIRAKRIPKRTNDADEDEDDYTRFSVAVRTAGEYLQRYRFLFDWSRANIARGWYAEDDMENRYRTNYMYSCIVVLFIFMTGSAERKMAGDVALSLPFRSPSSPDKKGDTKERLKKNRESRAGGG